MQVRKCEKDALHSIPRQATIFCSPNVFLQEEAVCFVVEERPFPTRTLDTCRGTRKGDT